MTAARKRSALTDKPAAAPPPLQLLEAERGWTLVTQASRDLDAADEVILTTCGRRIERHADRRENLYTLWEPTDARRPASRYGRTKTIDGAPWGAAHTLRWSGQGEPDHVTSVEWEMRQWARATTVIRAVCPELGALEGVGGMVLETRGEVLLSGTPRVRYEHAVKARRPADV